ncbi:MAG: sulfite exporter TauE/SafE family protein [Desulfuromonadales bacterium]|nr:sulfite exporter TauE/SafE family protein [Desulfuromonadales bacterium]
MDILQMLLLAGLGVVAGILNVLAGGGSLMTLPVLIFMGLPAPVANGTNRIAILCQNVVAVGGFKSKGVFPAKLALLCTVPALIGSVIGAQLAIDISEELFRQILAVVMIGVILLMVFDPNKRLKVDEQHMTPLRTAVLLFSFFLIGIYGGFIQAGVGFLIMSGLLVHGLDLVKINAVKVFVVLFYTIIAMAVFIWHDQVNYPLGIALAIGNSAGGWIGSHLAVEKGHDWIRRLVIIVVVIFAIKLVWF